MGDDEIDDEDMVKILYYIIKSVKLYVVIAKNYFY